MKAGSVLVGRSPIMGDRRLGRRHRRVFPVTVKVDPVKAKRRRALRRDHRLSNGCSSTGVRMTMKERSFKA
jgi:hypothetical protein